MSEQEDSPENTVDDGATTDDGNAEAAAPGESYEPEAIEPTPTPPRGADINLDVVMDVPVNVALRVGQASISIRDLIALVEGSVIELDREATDPMDVLVNDTLVAHGEIVVVDDKFGVRLTDVVSPGERIGTLN
ncbi:MAG: flagellar motor switch protein FliN [Pseudomonadota bacterium]